MRYFLIGYIHDKGFYDQHGICAGCWDHFPRLDDVLKEVRADLNLDEEKYLAVISLSEVSKEDYETFFEN
jgi:hypothetical protein